MNRDLLSNWLEDNHFAHGVLHDRPLVTLSYAQSLDGAITATKGQPTALSGDDSNQATHLIRSRHDGIVVGIGTVLSDNPRLTVRLVEGSDPRPLIFDTELRTPPDSKFIDGNSRPFIFCGANRSRTAELRLEARGVKVIPVQSGQDGGLNIAEILNILTEHKIMSLMVEGGGEIITTFIDSGFWDRAAITVVPRWIGGYRPVPSQRLPVNLSDVHWIPAGNDVLCLGRRAS